MDIVTYTNIVNELMERHNNKNQRLKSAILKMCLNKVLIVTREQIEEWILADNKEIIKRQEKNKNKNKERVNDR